MDVDFDEWYRSQYRGVVAACAALGGNPDAAREATDEAFSRALARWKTVGAMHSPGGWVCRVALNCLRRALRREALERRLLARQRTATIPAPLPTPELWSAVQALPPRQRTAVVLRYVADLPEADIAVAMHVARGTIAATLARARRNLEAELTEQEEVPHG